MLEMQQMTRTNINPVVKLLLLVVVIVSLAAIILMIKPSRHSFEGHSVSDIQSGIDCFKNKGATRAFITQSGKNNRITWLCFDGNYWYSMIDEQKFKLERGHEPSTDNVTIFKVDKFDSIDDYIKSIVDRYKAVEIKDPLYPRPWWFSGRALP
jgi:hypothetical protein